MTTQTSTTSVSTSVDVGAPVAHAFRVFTAGIGSWWDADKHILDAPLASMEFQPWVGGHIIDHGVDGSECRWARVLVYEPPTRVCFSWDINTRWQLETDPSRTSEVEITFAATGPDQTRVVLTHRHLDGHGDGWEGMRDAVGSGWSLAGFADTAATTADAPCVFMVLHWPAPEHRDQLAASMNGMRSAMQSQPGCLGVDPPLLSEDGRCLVGYSRWESPQAFWAAGITPRRPDEIVEGELRPRQAFLLNPHTPTEPTENSTH